MQFIQKSQLPHLMNHLSILRNEIQKADSGGTLGCCIVLMCIGACFGDHGTVIDRTRLGRTVIRRGICCD